MKITFFGVRGSIPSPGAYTAKYGGNTSCVYIELDDKRTLTLDSGTGIRLLGNHLMKNQSLADVNILLSHAHWDHIQGYPFFIPIYIPEKQIDVYTNKKEGDELLHSMFDQMDGNNFPIKAEDLPSKSSCISGEMIEHLARKNICVSSKNLNHPGGGVAYKITEEDMTIAYVTDNELDPPYAQSTNYDEWVEFLNGVDVLIHDAQYTEDDMPHKHGWGHSLISQVRQLAVDAKVSTLVMFHHDPDRTDSELDEVQIENEKHMRSNLLLTQSICAAEGMTIELTRPILGTKTKVEIIN